MMALGLTSCGNSHGKLIEKQIDAMNEYADEYAKDPKSSKLAKIDEKIQEVSKKMDKLDTPSESETKKLKEKYGDKMASAAQRYAKAKLGSMIGADLGDMMKGFGEAFGK